MLVSYSFSVARLCLVSRKRRSEKKGMPSLNRDEASPPTPLRMERGVDSIIYKQRGRFFDVKRCPFHCKETPSSIERGRSFI